MTWSCGVIHLIIAELHCFQHWPQACHPQSSQRWLHKQTQAMVNQGNEDLVGCSPDGSSHCRPYSKERAIGQVAHVIHKIGSGQRWTRWVWIRRNRFRVIHGIAGGIHGSTIWKVANIVSILQISKCIALVGVAEAIVVSHLSTRATWLGGASSNTRLDSGIPPLKWHNIQGTDIWHGLPYVDTIHAIQYVQK